MDAAQAGRDGVGWFVRRAGLARFATFACAGGLALSAATGPHPMVALAGLTLALVGALVGVVRSRAGFPLQTGASQRVRVDLSRPACHSALQPKEGPSPMGAWLLLVSVLLVGLFGGYLIGSLRVTALTGGVLQSHIGDAIEAELCITGQVRANAGWQSATAVVRSARGAPAALGETVLLEVAPAEDVPSRPGGGQAAAGEAAVRADAVLAQGMIVVVKGSIEAPEGPSDSGYDQAKQLLHQGIEVVLRVDGPGAVAVIGRRGGVHGWFDGLRESAKVHLSRGPSAAVNEVLQGVVMGDTAGIDKGWMTAFRRSGTAHMLSVSGLHVASLAAIMIGLARLLRAARWVGFVMAAASALLMIPFVGASPPIIRAAVMICVVLMGRWVGRGRDQWQVLAFAAILVLALNPFAVFDVGFQLSFAAFVGMLVLLGPLQRWLRRLPAGIASNVAVSVAASAGTAPVALLVFDQTSLVSPLANLLVVPTLPLVTALGMASVFLGFAWNGLSTGLDTLASLPMMWTIQVSRLMAVAPVLQTGDLGRAALALAAGAAALPAAVALTGRTVRTPLGLLLPFFRRTVTWLRSHRPRDRRRAAALAVMVVTLAMVAGAAAYSPVAGVLQALQAVAYGRGWPDQVEVRVLDVGQGNAVLVRTPQHHTLLFDGGPAGCDLAGQLRGLGVRKIDVVVISHPHADHFAGLLEGLEGLKVETLVDPVRVVPSAQGDALSGGARAGPAEMADGAEAAEYLDLRRLLANDGCEYVLAGTGYIVTVDGVSARFYAPKEPLVIVDGADPWAEIGSEPSGDQLNGSSLVAVVSIGAIDVLIPGDAEAEVLERYDLPPTEVVVVPHHGSRGAVSQGLLQQWGTRAAFVSVGEANSFGHPDDGTVMTLEQSVGTVLRTDTAGWVSCRVDGDQMVITAERTPSQ